MGQTTVDEWCFKVVQTGYLNMNWGKPQAFGRVLETWFVEDNVKGTTCQHNVQAQRPSTCTTSKHMHNQATSRDMLR